MNQERQTAGSTRVLILDEDRVEGGMLAFHLRREGLVVMLMTSAEEAADAIAWAEPDVLLIEVAAQGFDGTRFLEELAHRPVDVFAVSDRQLPAEVELDALRLGVIDVMMKPIDPVTLARRLKERPRRKHRGSIAGLPEGGISGDLAVHSIVHLLQMAHRHRLNARIHAEIAGDWAVLLVRHGEVIDAEAPAATGREAVFQMIRAKQGAFVLFPLPSEAEELSRDDVIRANLAALVAEAMGRREPRAVNALRARDKERFVLPHVGSPRAPLAVRGNQETLEYTAVTAQLERANEGARVRRPGERERDPSIFGGAQSRRGADPTMQVPPAPQPKPPRRRTDPQASPPPPPRRQPTDPQTSLPAPPRRRTDPQLLASEPPELPVPRGRSSEVGEVEPEEHEPFPIESPTVDEGFDENTDQHLRRTGARAPSRHASSASMGAVQSSPIVRSSALGSGLRPVRRAGTDPELEAHASEGIAISRDDRPDGLYDGQYGRRRRLSSQWSLPTMVLAGVAAVLAIFIVARLATRSPPGPVDVGDDPTLRLGKALIDLDEGREDQARAELATLASDQEATDEVLVPLAKLHYRDGRLLEAQALFERLVEGHPGNPGALAWLGLVQAERKEMERARATFGRALPNARGDLADRLRWLVAGERAPAPRPQ